jgi:hypothetical protein
MNLLLLSWLYIPMWAFASVTDLIRGHVCVPNSEFYGVRLSSLMPNQPPNRDDQASVFIGPTDRVPQLYPSTGSPFWSPFTTRTSYGGAILIPWSPHGGNSMNSVLKLTNVTINAGNVSRCSFVQHHKYSSSELFIKPVCNIWQLKAGFRFPFSRSYDVYELLQKFRSV